MKLRTTCRCGAEFEAQTLFPGHLGAAWNVWFRLHAPCLGIEGYHSDESGKLVYTPSAPVQADARTQSSEPGGEAALNQERRPGRAVKEGEG